MARSSYIYQLVEEGSGETIGAFTVKHEMETMRQQQRKATYVVRYRDGQHDRGTIIE